jgi:hypothetical protein
MAISVERAETLANQAAQNVIANPEHLRNFRRKPDIVIDKYFTDLKLKNVTPEEKDELKVKAKQKIIEWDQVLPGLNVEEAKRLLLSSIESTSRSFSIFTWLNVTLFGVGIALFILAAVLGVVREQAQFSIIFGSGGVVSLLPFFISNPLKRISNSASDQSQIKTVIMGYWSQLANCRRQIIAQDNPGITLVKDCNLEIQNAMKQSAELLQKYAENAIKEPDTESESKIKELEKRLKALEDK